MHICFISSEYPVFELPHGGVGTFIRNLGYKLVENNIQVSVIRMWDEPKSLTIDDNGVKVYLFSKKIKFVPDFYSCALEINKVVKQIHKTQKIDIIETPELGLAFINKIENIKYIIRMHGGHHFFTNSENRKKEWRKVWQEKKSFKKVDHILAVSKYVADTTVKLLKIDKSVTVLYNPIDMNRFYQADYNKIEKHSIFFGGTIIEKKGIRQLIQSLEYLIDDFPDLKLYIAGRDAIIPGTNISYRPILEKEISKKMAKHIHFLGTIPNFDMPNQIEKANVCCYPSHMEAMPLAWLEVLAMGKTFIGSKTGPGPEAVQDGITGLLVDPYDPIDIAEKIRFVFENPIMAKQLGERARIQMIKEFDVAVMVDKNIQFYKSILY